MQQTDYERRGYLHEDFRLFHLSSALAEDTAFHYHEFHKLVFFLAGRGNYIVEGRTHVLRPYDVVLVRQGVLRYGLFRRRGSALVILDPAVNGFQFSVQVFNALPQIGKQHIKLVFDSL